MHASNKKQNYVQNGNTAVMEQNKTGPTVASNKPKPKYSEKKQKQKQTLYSILYVSPLMHISIFYKRQSLLEKTVWCGVREREKVNMRVCMLLEAYIAE